MGTDYTAYPSCKCALLLDTNNSTQPDASGNGNTGSVSGATFTTTSKFGGGAYQFNGSGNYIKVVASGVSDLQPALKMTVVAFGYSLGNNQSYGELFAKSAANGTSSPYSTFGFEQDSLNQNRFYAYVRVVGSPTTTIQANTGVNNFFSSSSFTHGALVVSRDGSNNAIVTMYQDGNNVAQNNSTNTNNIYYDSTSGNGDIYLGNNGSGGGNSFNGNIDDFAFFNDALTSTEINDIKDNGLKQTGGTSASVTQDGSQASSQLTFTTGTQSIAAVQNTSVTQVGANLTLSGGTQSITTGSMVNASVTQVATNLTFTTGTHSVGSVCIANVTQLAGTITFTGGSQVVTANVATRTGYKYDSTNHWITFMVNGAEVARLKDNGDLDLHGAVNQNAF